MSHQGGPMVPGIPRPSLAPGPPTGAQPGLSMAPTVVGPGQGSTLPIQPLHVGPGLSGTVNSAPRPLTQGHAPGTQQLPISPLNMPSAGQPPAPHLGMSAVQMLNLNLNLQGQANPAFPQSLPQQPAQQAPGGLKRPVDAGGVADGNPAAKRTRLGEGESDAGINQIARPGSAAPAALPAGGPAATAAGAAPAPSQPQQPQSGAPNVGLVPTAAAASNPGADLAALIRANPYAAAYSQLQQVAAAQAAQAAARRRAAAAAAAAADPDDERRLLPRRGIRMALRAVGMDRDYAVDPATEAALQEFYTEWISNAVALGCEAAKGRNSNVLKARDIAIHLERSWNLHIPGFNGEGLKPYRRPNASELHRQRQLAVRRTAGEMDHQQQQLHHHSIGGGGHQVAAAVSPGASAAGGVGGGGVCGAGASAGGMGTMG
ncbi:hypothetical protein Vretimale_15942 [Volvox reticuliferus]|uniref:Transcription initiation factor TFIID subunit 12 domain-containing protein n=1 Tax=Volvox reticuliferus TaxID=1737510 RepID=A0A8J4GSC7_9CHLO|nr:hypothetical protein Vretifemale_13003 [Volvox reticuliferus]GIM12628.1 hypothetical protein Vretimale_15942 [Volvox reticuliferus]